MPEQIFISTYPGSAWYAKKFREVRSKNDPGFRWESSSISRGIPKGAYIRPIDQDKVFVIKKKRNYGTKKVKQFEIFKHDGSTLCTSEFSSALGRYVEESIHLLDWNEICRHVRPATEQEISELKDKFLSEAIQELW